MALDGCRLTTEHTTTNQQQAAVEEKRMERRCDAKGRTTWGEWGWNIVWSAEKIENYSIVTLVDCQWNDGM
jgi:hypothetical protein